MQWPKMPKNRSIWMATPAHLKVPPAQTAVKSAALAAGSAANPQFLSKAAKRKGLARPNAPGRIRCEPNLVIVATFASPSPSSLRKSDRPSLAQQPCIWRSRRFLPPRSCWCSTWPLPLHTPPSHGADYYLDELRVPYSRRAAWCDHPLIVKTVSASSVCVSRRLPPPCRLYQVR